MNWRATFSIDGILRHLICIAALLMWGGIGQLDTSVAFRLPGAIPVQDAVALSAGVLLVLLLLLSKREIFYPVLLISSYTFLALGGLVVGMANDTPMRDILSEMRSILYLPIGVAVATTTGRAEMVRMLVIYGQILAVAVILQNILFLVGSDIEIVSGVRAGNQFTMGLPIVRPSGGIHVVGCACLAAICCRLAALGSFWPCVTPTVAIILTQSKTYVLLIAFGVACFIVLYSTTRRRAPQFLLAAVAAILVVLAVSGLVAGFVGGAAQDIVLLPLEKFQMLFTDSEIRSGIVGTRIEEVEMMAGRFSESATRMVFGTGWGFIYRDVNDLFYREDERERENLAMKSHFAYMWLLLKSGILGTVLFLASVAVPMVRGLQNGATGKTLFTASAVLVGSAITMGTFTIPAGAFLLGACSAASGNRDP